MLRTIAVILLLFVAFYPVITAAFWIAGGFLFRRFDEANDGAEPPGGWPAVSVLIPAYNEEAVIADCVRAALEVDYPRARGPGPRRRLDRRDRRRRGESDSRRSSGRGCPGPRQSRQGDRLNAAFAGLATSSSRFRRRYAPPSPALKLLVSRMSRSPLIATDAGSPHVTNRRSLLAGLQILEAASIIGLLRRTWALIGRVGVVAGVLGLFRLRRFWRSVAMTDGWPPRTSTSPGACCSPAGTRRSSPRPSSAWRSPRRCGRWAQRCRWARGQGEVLRRYARTIARRRNRRMWPVALEASASFAWVIATALALWRRCSTRSPATRSRSSASP